MKQKSNGTRKRLAMISVPFIVALGLLLGLGQPAGAATTREGREQGATAAVVISPMDRRDDQAADEFAHQVAYFPHTGNAAVSSTHVALAVPSIPWEKIKAMVKKWGLWVWYKAHLCVAEVIRQWGRIIVSPPNTWVYKAALACAWGMR